MKGWIQDNFRERMQLRRTLIELEDTHLLNSIEIGKRQLIIAKWNEGARRRRKQNPGT